MWQIIKRVSVLFGQPLVYKANNNFIRSIFNNHQQKNSATQLKNPKNLPIFVFKVKTYENAEVSSFIHAFVGNIQYECPAKDIL
jgi:hypothetical protein